jgi:hypothetical protein
MRQYTETYRVTITPEMKQKLVKLKIYNVVPTRFVRKAIEEKFKRDWKEIQAKKVKTKIPF